MTRRAVEQVLENEANNSRLAEDPTQINAAHYYYFECLGRGPQEYKLRITPQTEKVSSERFHLRFQTEWQYCSCRGKNLEAVVFLGQRSRYRSGIRQFLWLLVAFQDYFVGTSQICWTPTGNYNVQTLARLSF